MKLADLKIGDSFIASNGRRYTKHTDNSNLEFDKCLVASSRPYNRMEIVHPDFVRIKRTAEVTKI